MLYTIFIIRTNWEYISFVYMVSFPFFQLREKSSLLAISSKKQLVIEASSFFTTKGRKTSSITISR